MYHCLVCVVKNISLNNNTCLACLNHLVTKTNLHHCIRLGIVVAFLRAFIQAAKRINLFIYSECFFLRESIVSALMVRGESSETVLLGGF